MTQKLRTVHGIKVPRHLVNNILFDLIPDGLQGRSLQKQMKKDKGSFYIKRAALGSFCDGHNKLCGYLKG